MKYVLLLLLLVTPSAAFGFAPAQQEPRIVKLNKELPVGADVALFRVASDADRVAYITDGMFDRICVTSMAGHEEPLDLAPVHEGGSGCIRAHAEWRVRRLFRELAGEVLCDADPRRAVP